jgi:hypothetical protein
MGGFSKPTRLPSTLRNRRMRNKAMAPSKTKATGKLAKFCHALVCTKPPGQCLWKLRHTAAIAMRQLMGS